MRWPPLIIAANVLAGAYVLAAAAWYLGKRYNWYWRYDTYWRGPRIYCKKPDYL